LVSKTGYRFIVADRRIKKVILTLKMEELFYFKMQYSRISIKILDVRI